MGLVALFSSNLLPTFYGYIGSAAFIFIVMIFILAQAEFTDKNINLLRNVSIGLLLLLIVLIRRWYAYEVVAYFVSSALFILIYNLIKKDFDLFQILSDYLFKGLFRWPCWFYSLDLFCWLIWRQIIVFYMQRRENPAFLNKYPYLFIILVYTWLFWQEFLCFIIRQECRQFFYGLISYSHGFCLLVCRIWEHTIILLLIGKCFY